MQNNAPDERLVYWALKHVFKGKDAEVRNSKPIRKHVEKHKDDESVKALIAEHNIDNVCKAAKSLLEQKVFESTIRAKIRFPELFEVSPAQSAERANSVAEAARSEVNAIKEATEVYPEPGPSREHALNNVAENQKRKRAGMNNTQEYCDCADYPDSESTQLSPQRLDGAHQVPSLYPVYLPLKSQHQLLVELQTILEAACFEFASQHFVQMLDDEGWDSAECVELNMWMGIFRRHNPEFSAQKINTLGKPLGEFLTSITQIRHTAVHRTRLTTKTIEEFLVESELLARLLDAESQAQKLSSLRRDIQSIIDELSCNKDWLEGRCRERLGEIAKKRVELDCLERAAIEEMLKEDRDYQVFAGESLQNAVAAPRTAIHSPKSSVLDGNSETSNENESFDEIDLADH